MRDHIRCIIAVGLMLMPALCPAQGAAAWHDSVLRANVAMRAMHDSLYQGDSTAAEVARHGDLSIAASPNEAANAAAALDRFAQIRARRFGDAMPSFSGFRIVVRTEGAARAPSAGGGDVTGGSVVLTGMPDSGAAVRIQGSVRSAELAEYLINHYGEMMVASIPALSAWTNSTPPLSMDETDRRDQAMYAFITSTGESPRRCVAGDLTGCELAFNLKRTSDPENDRRLSQFLRADLLFFALDVGGTGAWNRLSSAADSGTATMLASAAQLPTDTLLAHWRQSLLSRRPPTALLTPATSFVALAWTLLILGSAVGASRWS
jgi:hypothetical protein